MDFQIPVKPSAFQIMLKPVGPICNLDCTYCYYLEKTKLYPEKGKFRLEEDLLEIFIKDYIESQDLPVVTFVWQGGEPAMLGIDYFRKAVELQKKYAGKKRIDNCLQTNATLFDDEFCKFLNENNFLVGVSIDGPRELHDHYRVDKQGNPTWNKVMAGIELLKKHRVEFNTLSTVSKLNSQYPLEVYRFLKDIGSTFMQFLPIVERIAKNVDNSELGLVHQHYEGEAQLTEWSISPGQYGEFLKNIFDEWVRYDVGRYYVQLFDVTLANWFGADPGLCVFSEKCGTGAVMEHNGDVYSCDHYVYEDHYLGNISKISLSNMMALPKQSIFGQDKRGKLPASCYACEYLFACHGGCPKNRFLETSQGEKGLNYLCKGYKMFFEHSKPYMKYMVNELKAEKPPANVMQWIKNKENNQEQKKVFIGRNNPCPCGSRKKYKHCHGK